MLKPFEKSVKDLERILSDRLTFFFMMFLFIYVLPKGSIVLIDLNIIFFMVH